MTNNLQQDANKDKKPETRTLETEWVQAFDQLEQFGVNVAHWLNQLGIGADADLQHMTLAEPVNGAARAKVKLDMTIGAARIQALPANSTNLVEAEIVSIGTVEMAATTEGDVKSVRLRQRRNTDDLFKPVKDAVDTVARIDELQWAVGLSPDVPMSLEVGAGLTIAKLDFTGLQLSRLKMDGGTGHTVITLPASVTTADIDGGFGVLDLHVPDEAKVTLHMNNGAGATNVFIGDANVKAEIDGGVGNCTVVIPADAAVRLRADSGLGNITVPQAMREVKFDTEFISESGVWQTGGFEFAARKIDIRYEGGVGSLILQYAAG
jgi:hypothetical protein